MHLQMKSSNLGIWRERLLFLERTLWLKKKAVKLEASEIHWMFTNIINDHLPNI